MSYRGPTSPPEGWHGLHFAFDMFAVHALALGWHPDQFDGEKRPDLVKLVEADDPMRSFMGHDEYAGMHFTSLCHWFASAALAGLVPMAYRHKDGGDLFEMPAEWWDTDDPTFRFLGGDVNPLAPLTRRDGADHWVLVSVAGLNRLCAEAVEWRGSLRQVDIPANTPLEGVPCLDGMLVPARVVSFSGETFFAPINPPSHRVSRTVIRAAANDRHSDKVVPIAMAARMPETREISADATAKNPPHRPAKRPEILAAFAGRLREGVVRKNRPDEVTKLLKAWTKSDPPARDSVSGWVGPFHSKLEWGDHGATNAQEIARLVDADLAEKG